MAAKGKPNEITLTRVYDAPVKAVWDAWNDPEKAKHWWGPRGFTLTTHSKDLRPGGKWVYTMHGPDGTDFPNSTVYLEVEPFSRLVYDHGGKEGTPPLFRVTVHFTEIKGKTRMEMTMALATPEAAERTRKFIKQAGGEATWDRLAEYLGEKLSDKKQFIINRSFEVPMATIFEMWTNPKHFANWMGPKGFTMEFVRTDIKPGGSTFYFMTNGSVKFYGRAEYREIQKPDRIVYTQQFADENEKVSRHPMAPLWPETMLTTVTLTEESPTTTRVTVVWEPAGAVTNAEIEAFIKERGGMTQGWTGSFDKLDEYLASL